MIIDIQLFEEDCAALKLTTNSDRILRAIQLYGPISSGSLGKILPDIGQSSLSGFLRGKFSDDTNPAILREKNERGKWIYWVSEEYAHLPFDQFKQKTFRRVADNGQVIRSRGVKSKKTTTEILEHIVELLGVLVDTQSTKCQGEVTCEECHWSKWPSDPSRLGTCSLPLPPLPICFPLPVSYRLISHKLGHNCPFWRKK